MYWLSICLYYIFFLFCTYLAHFNDFHAIDDSFIAIRWYWFWAVNAICILFEYVTSFFNSSLWATCVFSSYSILTMLYVIPYTSMEVEYNITKMHCEMNERKKYKIDFDIQQSNL